MIEEFPDLKNNEVALARARKATGQLVDEGLQLAISKLQKVFTVFKDLDTALASAREIIRTNDEIEIALYGREQTVLRFITKDNVDEV